MALRVARIVFLGVMSLAPGSVLQAQAAGQWACRAETLDFLWRAMRELLTTRQRQVFQAAVLDEVPIDVLADRLGSTRGAIYKVLHDARRTLRAAMARAGEELP